MTTSPFVGRDEDLAFLAVQLEATRADGGRLALLSGLSGMGKTALVQRFLGGCEGILVLQGRGWDNQAAASFQPLREVVGQLLDTRPGLLDAPADRPLRTLLASLVADQPETTRASLETEQLCRALAALLRAAAADGPVCVFLDDLQWADEGTLMWLDYALRELAASPVLWIGAYRREDHSALATLLVRGERWTRDGRWSERELGPLSREETRDLCRQPPGTWQDADLDRIWESTGGLPLHVVDAHRALGQTDSAPASARAITAGRLNRLDTGERVLLTLGAVAGEAFAVAPVAEALERDPIEVHEELRRIAAAIGLVETSSEGWRFVHSGYREALVEELPADVAAAYHRRLLTSRQLPEAARAYHLVHGGDPAAAAQALVTEGDRAMGRGDWRTRCASTWRPRSSSRTRSPPRGRPSSTSVSGTCSS